MNEEKKKLYTQLVKESRKIANNALKNFYNNLGLEPERVEHLLNIPLKMGRTDENADAQYVQNENFIIFNVKYLEKMAKHLVEIPKEKVLLHIAVSYVHEVIHANRTLYINDGLNVNTIKEIADNELIKFDQDKKYDLNNYISILNNITNTMDISNIETYIPITFKQNEDKTYTVIAYNKKTKNFEEFANQNFNINSNDNENNQFHILSQELNNQNSLHKPTNTIFTFFKEDDKVEKVALACEYYHPYTKEGKIVPDEELEGENLSSQEFVKLLDRKTNEIIDRLENQTNFEEIITETLANIIIMTRNSDKIDLEELYNILENSNADLDTKMCIKMLKETGIDIIKWFMTAVYDEVYEDKFEEIFGDRYTDLLMDFNDLYEALQYDEEPDEFSIRDINEIIEEKLTSKKTK